MDVTQIRLIVSDFPAVYRFYRDVIGLKPQFESENGPYVAFKPDFGSALALHDRAELTTVIPDLKPHSGDNSLISLRVDDLDAYLTQLDATTTEPVVLDGRVKVAYLRDPEENLLELQQWLATRSGADVPPAGD
jgi:catechol 2,3-dioxygenase-like lactoylglutathione lyase family enzyme